MIRKVHFQNFRCLRDVELTLEPLTVPVGPNSSGKTTVLEGLSPRFYQRSDLWRHDEKQRIFIVWSYEDDSINEALFDPADPSRLEPSRSKVTRRGQAQTPRLRASLHEVQSLLLDTAELRRENTLAMASRLNPTGDNLTNVFASLTRQQQTTVA